MGKRKRRVFTPEFKTEAVKLCRAGGRTFAQVASDLGVLENSLRRWVAQADIDESKVPVAALTTMERDELQRLRRENKRLQVEREILKKAAAFFAKEST